MKTTKMFVYMGGGQVVPRNVTHVRVHKSVKIIRRHAFKFCRNLVSIEMHDGVEIIEEWAFWLCTSLRRIKLPGVRVIEEGAFSGCTSLVDIEFGDKLEIIGDNSFCSCISLQNIEIPKVRVIGSYAFSHCDKLTDVELSEDLVAIGEGGFWRCLRLRRIAIPLKNNLLLGGNVFGDCRDLSHVDLIGEIHKTIPSLLLESWRNEMNNEIDSINQILPLTPRYKKTAAIQRWMERVIRRIEHYKSRRASDDGVMEDTSMDNPSFGQSEESTQPKDPKKQVAVHNDDSIISRREEDETSRSVSSAGGGSNLEDAIPEAEIEGMAVEIKDDSSFGGGDQNGDFRIESDVKSEIQRLKAQLKETQKRLKESEEDKNQQRKEYERKVEFLEEENVRLKKRLKVSVQTSADLLEAALKVMKVVHEPEVIRQLAEEGLLECLRNHKVELGRSKIEGARFGAFAIAKISGGERIFHFNGDPSNETISLTEDKIAKLPPHVQRVVKMYTRPNDDGLRDVPKNGFAFALGISWFLNTAHGTEFEANVDVGPKLDESGFAELIALRDIEPGEELLDSYALGDTL